ncbi:unnamed protein product, partial [Rotaria sp. Silwood1]
MVQCEIAEPKMTYTCSNAQNKYIIHINQKGQMENIQDKNLGTLQPVSQEVKFTNTNLPLPLPAHFKIEPDNVVMQPNANSSVQFIYYPVDLRPFNAKVESYCSILNYIVSLTHNQKTFVNKSLTIIWNILCEASKSQTTIASIVNQILHLLHILNEQKNWSSIQESYYQHYTKPSWKTMLIFISTIGCNNEIIPYINKLENAHEEETMANIILEIGCFISTNDELISFNKYQSSIKSLELTTSSTIKLLENLQNIVPQELQEQIQAYLIITRLPNIITIS